MCVSKVTTPRLGYLFTMKLNYESLPTLGYRLRWKDNKLQKMRLLLDYELWPGPLTKKN